MKNATVVILCGGKGLRIGELTVKVPKPLISIGAKPILWHVMKLFASQGVTRFVLCLGYKHKQISSYFARHNKEHWHVQCVDTGKETLKSQRIERVKHLIKTENFFLAYGDDVADISIEKLWNFHLRNKAIVTITAVRMVSEFGLMQLDKNNRITDFKEKPKLNQWINGGFMAAHRKIFDVLDAGELEKEVFEKLVRVKKICAYKHYGQWKAMNTFKDYLELNELWKHRRAFWKLWED